MDYKDSTNRMENIVFFSGSSHPELADKIATQLGIFVSNSIHDRRIELHANVRGRHVYILQTGCCTLAAGNKPCRPTFNKSRSKETVRTHRLPWSASVSGAGAQPRIYRVY